MVNTSDLRKSGEPVERPTFEPDATLPNRTLADIETWRILTDRIYTVATANKWNRAEVARRAGVEPGTFYPWYNGDYKGRLDNTNQSVSKWLDAVEESADLLAAVPKSPAFIKTIASAEIMDTLTWAQATTDFVFITYAAGMGKTVTCRQYQATRPHVYMVTMSPHTRTVHGMLVELAAELDVMQHNPAKLTRAIGNRLARTGGGALLIVDEAQNLVDDAINQLRHFVDIYKCGLALVGNEEVYGRFSRLTDKGAHVDGPSYGQLRRRVGRRIKRDRLEASDLLDFISAWGISEPESVKLLTLYGRKAGALGQIDQTMKQAAMYALGEGKPIGVSHIRAAWTIRDVEDLT